ncbi:MAG: hypothetical protein EP344_15780 [Bacteroidetes bacterium]|nr:MAG: hypothetical protein EP344_15780 [Bacteroidota bacterium]
MNKLLGLLVLVVFFGACKDEDEPIPAYLQIEPFAVNALGGADWQKITDAWVYVDDQFLGGYTLPATVPVLANGNATVRVYAGVKENGLQQTPALYPFLDYYETSVTLSPATTTVISPETQYVANAVFPWLIERTTFNTTSLVLENRDNDTVTTFVLTTAGAFEGRSVKMAVDTAHSIIEIATELVEDLPSTGDRQVWLELHYKNDMPFELWLLGSQGSTSNELSRPVYQFLPSVSWNKIYFNLTDFLVNLQQDDYRLFFRVSLPRNINGDFQQEQGEVFLDNIRLVHF